MPKSYKSRSLEEAASDIVKQFCSEPEQQAADTKSHEHMGELIRLISQMVALGSEAHFSGRYKTALIMLDISEVIKKEYEDLYNNLYSDI